jgi:hypothetical protein
VNECLDESFSDSGLVLQDIVNELGARLECKVEPGLYRGKAREVGVDGIWRFPDGYSIVVEVKTTDTYTINLDKIAGYRKALIDSKRIFDQSSMLVVVGRQDTGSLEAQVRGSRHAWDLRIISVDALLRLAKIKESADNKATIEKIRSVLTPRELTKLDFIVDLVATTAEDIAEITDPKGGDDVEVSKKEKKFTPVAFNDEVAEATAFHLGMSLKKTTRSLYVSTDRKTSVRAVVSKAHVHGENIYYWYAFHPYYKEVLADHADSYIVFGCGSPEKILLFPLTEFIAWLDDMNTTQKEGRMYFHVHFLEHKDGTIRLHFKGGIPSKDVSDRKINIP